MIEGSWLVCDWYQTKNDFIYRVGRSNGVSRK